MKCIHKERTEIGFAVHALFTPENLTKNPLRLGKLHYLPQARIPEFPPYFSLPLCYACN